MAPEVGLYLIWALWAASWWAAAFWAAPVAARVPFRREFVYRALLVLGVVLLFGLAPRHLWPVRLWQLSRAGRWACCGVAVMGFAFCWWARLHLGRLWSANVTRKQDHRIVDSGPYRLVRHPIYTGIILASLATVAQKGTPVAILGAAVLTVSWTVKARLEERFLRQELGLAAYDAYAARVPMLIPFAKF